MPRHTSYIAFVHIGRIGLMGLTALALAACGPDGGADTRRDATGSSWRDGHDGGLDAYLPPRPASAVECTSDSSPDCAATCHHRVQTCAGHAACPALESRGAWFAARCSALCDQYPTFARLLCDATTCDGFVGALVDLVPDGQARCSDFTENEIIDACVALGDCATACQALPARSIPACETGCANDAGRLAEVAARRLVDWQICLGTCLAEGCSMAACTDIRCRCAHDGCFGEGVAGEAMLGCIFRGVQTPAGAACTDHGLSGDVGRRCGELAECLDGCDRDRDCVRRCSREASADAFGLYRRVSRCEAETGCGDRHACRTGPCRAEWNACAEHAFTYGQADCDFLIDCTRGCEARPSERYCNQACRTNATREANIAFDALQRCVELEGCSLSTGCEACARLAEDCRAH